MTAKTTRPFTTLTEDATVTQDNMLDPKEDDAINPSHYKSHPSGVECIDISKHLSGCLAQAFQYVWRCGQKDDPIQELDKAIWFIKAEMTVDEYAIVNYSAIEDNIVLVRNAEIDNHKAIALTNIAIANKHMNKYMTGQRIGKLSYAIQSIEELKTIYVRCGV